MSAVRASMMPIINRTRDLIFDAAGEAQTFSNQKIQDVLDETRVVVRYAPLELWMTHQPGTGALLYTDYFANVGPWEGLGTAETPSTTSDTNTYLVGPNWAILSPTTADLITGHWTFSAGQVPPVFIVGARYDMYSSAATFLRKLAAQLKLKFDVSTKEQMMARSQQVKMCLQLAAEYDRKSQPMTCSMRRSDTDGSNQTNAPSIDGSQIWW